MVPTDRSAPVAPPRTTSWRTWALAAATVVVGLAGVGVLASPSVPLGLVTAGPTLLVALLTTREVRSDRMALSMAVGLTLAAATGVLALVGAGHRLPWAAAAAGLLALTTPRRGSHDDSRQ